MKKTILLFVGCLIICACGNSSKRNSPEISFYNDDSPSETINDEQDGQGGYDDDSSDNLDIGNIQLTGRIETCSKCMGYGMVQDGMYAQPQICKFCWISTNMRIQQGWTGFDGGYGQVDAVFNTLPADYFDGLDWNTDNNGGGTSADQIESEIARHEENIAQLEHQLEYIEGSISRTQIEQQIIEERYEIKRLKAILNGM